MPQVRTRFLVALACSLVFHAGLVALSMGKTPRPAATVPAPLQVRFVIAPREENPAPEAGAAKPARRAKPSARAAVATRSRAEAANPNPPRAAKKLASMPAPPAPSAQEWKLASTYTLKNSKRYRYNWGRLVRSMMGTAVEGPRQGLVRLHIEIAPDGRLAQVDVLWSTSETAEKRALRAIRSLPPLPPTPTGKPLMFEKTIAFEPFETEWPPVYKYDCVADPPAFHNPFAQNGSAPRTASPQETDAATAQADCPPDAAPDSIEAEEKDMKRQFDQWGAGRLNGVH